MDERLHLKNKPSVILAGQVSGCEGYVESTAMGFLAARLFANPALPLPPAETALGSMLRHVTSGNVETFQPMNINFGIFPELQKTGGRKIKGADRKKLYTDRAISALDEWMKNFIY